MIAADTSSLIAYFQEEKAPDVLAITAALAQNRLRLPWIVITELLSDPDGASAIASTIADLPRLDILDGYWERAGKSRGIVLARGLKARLPDALVAQACIDHKIPLIARNGDFRHFAKHCGLILA